MKRPFWIAALVDFDTNASSFDTTPSTLLEMEDVGDYANMDDEGNGSDVEYDFEK